MIRSNKLANSSECSNERRGHLNLIFLFLRSSLFFSLLFKMLKKEKKKQASLNVRILNT
jgi:hypothetical protein